MVPETVEPRPELPEDLLAILDGLVDAESQTRQVIAGLTDTHLNWGADAGKKWSIAQCLDHLSKTNAFYAAAMRYAVGEVSPGTKIRRSQIQPGWLEKLFIRSMDAPARRKFRALRKVTPASFRSGEGALKAFCASHREIRSLTMECGGIDLNRV